MVAAPASTQGRFQRVPYSERVEASRPKSSTILDTTLTGLLRGHYYPGYALLRQPWAECSQPRWGWGKTTFSFFVVSILRSVEASLTRCMGARSNKVYFPYRHNIKNRLYLEYEFGQPSQKLQKQPNWPTCCFPFFTPINLAGSQAGRHRPTLEFYEETIPSRSLERILAPESAGLSAEGRKRRSLGIYYQWEHLRIWFGQDGSARGLSHR